MTYNFLKSPSKLAWMAGGFAAWGALMYPCTLGLEQFKNSIQSQTKNRPDDIDMEILQLIEEIKQDMMWRNTTFGGGHIVTFVPTKNLDFSRQGSVNTRWGAVVGVPALFTTNSIKRAEENPDILHEYNIDTKSEDGQTIFDTFKLSRAAKKFALAKEMCYVSKFKVFVDSSMISLSVLGCCILLQIVSELFPFPGVKLLSFLTLPPILALSYIKFYDNFNCYEEAVSDKKAAKISQDVAYGGLEYYTALLKQQEALGNSNKKHESNSVLTTLLAWRKPELTPAERLDKLQKFLEDLYPQKN